MIKRIAKEYRELWEESSGLAITMLVVVTCGLVLVGMFVFALVELFMLYPIMAVIIGGTILLMITASTLLLRISKDD